jgi:ABC-2 type transport system ATP-binding protein
MSIAIEITDLQKVIDNKNVINIEALRAETGQVVAIVGPIDSGKEVLFDLLTGQSRPTTGTIELVGLDPAIDRETFSHNVGVLFAEDNLYKRMSALDNLKFYCRIRRLPSSRAQDVLSLVGLADHSNVKVEKLPPSLVRRLAYGRAILNDPQVLLLVEPFEKCDQSTISLLSKLTRHLTSEGAAALILAEEPSNLSTLCNMIYRLDQGRVVEAYNPQEEPEPALPFMIPARLEGKVALVDPVDILYVMAQHDRAYLQTQDDLLPTQFTMTELEKRLSRSGFFRAHRGYLVNLQHVKEVIPYTRDSFSLKLKDESGTEIPLSKAAARELRELLGY